MNVTNNLNINWDDIDQIFKFAAMDGRGWVRLFIERPNPCLVEIAESRWGLLFSDHPVADKPKGLLGGWWDPSNEDWGVIHISDEASILKAPVDWKDTLTERPAKVK